MLSCIAHAPRAAYLVAPLSYDRTVAGEDERARECITRTRAQLMAAGYFPPRLDVGSMDLVAEGDEAYRALLRRLKRALDPNDILAPGRYGMG
jgi:4-cresol dehydrogenase (hydroxylating)